MFLRIILTIFFILALSDFAFAMSTEVGDVENFGEFVSEIWAWASQIIFGVSIITIIVGGIVLMLSGDDERNVNIGKTIIKSALFSSVLIAFSAVLLKVLHKPTINIDGPAKLSDASMVVSNIIYYLLGIVGGIAVIALIIGGLRLISSGGDFEKTRSAKNSVKFAVLGLIVSLTSFVVLKFVISPFTN